MPNNRPAFLSHWIFDWTETIVVALVLALIIRAFFLQVFWIPSGSMEPSLDVNDRIVVDKVSYHFRNPARFEIIVFRQVGSMDPSKKVPEATKKEGSLFPLSPITWQIGNPISSLDLVTSKSVAGVVIPGITTKQWEMKRGKHHDSNRTCPDLDLWLDSSESMENPTTGRSRAVISGMIVTKSFLAAHCSVRVINFSGVGQFQSTNGFETDEEAIDGKLVMFHGKGTSLPTDELVKPYLQDGKNKYVVLISDLIIASSTERDMKNLKIISSQMSGGTVLLIGDGSKSFFEELGFDVIIINDINDIENRTLQLTQRIFKGLS